MGPSNKVDNPRRQEQGEEGKDVDAGIAALEKEFRRMKADRHAFAHESDLVLRRQQIVIDKLRSENETLKTDITRLQTRRMVHPPKKGEQAQMDKLQQELTRYNDLLLSEKEKCAATEKEIAEVSDRLMKHRKKVGGANAAADGQRALEKQIKLTENKIDQTIIRFNKCVGRNKQLREEIDSERGERVTFEKVYKRLEKALREKKKEMALLIEQTNEAYEQRDEAQLEIIAMEKADRKDEKVYFEKMDKLRRKLDKINEELLNMNRQKMKPVVPDPAEEARKAAELEEIARAKEIARIEEGLIQEQKERLEDFEAGFRKISSTTGMSQVDELAEAFVARDNQNFSLFKLLNEQTTEIVRLENEIEALRGKAEMFKDGREKDYDEDTSNELANKMKLIQEKTLDCNKQNEAYEKTIDEVKEEVKLLLIKLDCKKESNELGVSVTADNLIECLGRIEDRADEIISDCQRLKGVSDDDLEKSVKLSFERTTKRKHKSLFRKRPLAPRRSKRGNITPPKLLDFSSDDSVEGRHGAGSPTLKPIHRENIILDEAALCAPVKDKPSPPKKKKVIMRRGNGLRRPKNNFSGTRNPIP